MSTVNPIISISSVEVYLNKLPPRDPNSAHQSVARAHVSLLLGALPTGVAYGTIALRGIHVIRNSNGGIFISFPGKARESGRFMEFASLTGPIMADVRNAVVSEYWRKYNARVAASVPTPTASIAASEPTSAPNRLRNAILLFEKAHVYAEATPEFDAVVVDDNNQRVTFSQVVERIEGSSEPVIYHLVLRGDREYAVASHTI